MAELGKVPSRSYSICNNLQSTHPWMLSRNTDSVSATVSANLNPILCCNYNMHKDKNRPEFHTLGRGGWLFFISAAVAPSQLLACTLEGRERQKVVMLATCFSSLFLLLFLLLFPLLPPLSPPLQPPIRLSSVQFS